MRLVPTPTYASYLNRIECHFWAFVEFVIRGSDYGLFATKRGEAPRNLAVGVCHVTPQDPTSSQSAQPA